MINGEVTKYVESKGWKSKIEGKEIKIETCPINNCNGFHFYMKGDDGAYYCHKCGASGSLWKLKQQLGDLPPVSKMGAGGTHKPPTINIEKQMEARRGSKAAMDFLYGRGFTAATLDHFRVGYKEKKIDKEIGLVGGVTLPFMDADGKPINTKWRSLVEKDFRLIPNCPKPLFNGLAIDRARPVIITEGEFDALAAYQLGFDNVVSLPNGARNIEAVTAIDNRETPEILIATDNDTEGDASAENISKLVSRPCRRLKFPDGIKDFNEALLAGMNGDDIQCLIDAAESMRRGDIADAGEIHDRLSASLENTSSAIKTGWTTFDAYLGGLRPGELTTVSADTGIGKTSWCGNVAYLVNKQDFPILVLTAEDSCEQFYSKLCSIHTGLCFETLHDETLRGLNPQYTFTRKHFQDCRNYFSKRDVYFWSGQGSLSGDQVGNLIRYCGLAYGVRLALVDNLHHFVSASNVEQERLAIEQFTRSLARCAIETGVHVMLVCHPTKQIGVTKGRVLMNDLKGSASIKQDSHNIITLYRNREHFQTETEVWIQKCRSASAREGKAIFTFNELNQRYACTSKTSLSNETEN
ncbi:MAG: DnaB-like helicase C-terminal domain-containing protein [bacterium]